MSTLSFTDLPTGAETELGHKAKAEIQRFLWHLARGAGGDTWDDTAIPDYDIGLRYAPSVILRGELQVCGVSAPRFALRFELNDKRGFVNLRRLKLLEDVLFDRYPDGSFPFPSGVVEPEFKKVPINLLNIANDDSIADSILSAPSRYPKRAFHHVTAKLANDFGEACPGEENYEGTPYVRTPVFGVGLCAQACCFVSTLLHPTSASHVCGLGEITALLADPNTHEFEIAGLSQEQILQYFESVNLHATWQLVKQNPYQPLNAAHHFEECLHAYVASNIPVILCLDINRLPRINMSPSFLEQPEELAHHAVTVIGCSRWLHLWPANSEGGHYSRSESVFLFHDSSSMPFSEATAGQLAGAGMRTVQEHPNYPHLIPVTPAEVKMPLLNWKRREEESDQGGLIEASVHAFDKHCRLQLRNREFLLAQLKSLPRLRLLPFFTGDNTQPVSDRLDELVEGARHNLHWDQDGNHWVWFEVGMPRTGSWLTVIKMWDAEAEPALLSDDEHGPREILCSMLAKDPDGSWRWHWNH
jgi:hypothetical protein